MALDWSWIGLLQLLGAALAGGLVGFVRELRGKPAGTTTIGLVTICSTLLMQLSFKLPALNGQAGNGDPARLAAAVITGIGFLGAGTIIRRGGHVDGLTSAATIWVMSAVGLAIGAGYYFPAGLVLVMVLIGFAVNLGIERFIVICRSKLGIKLNGEPKEEDEQGGL